jgi:hypothetical protein
MQNRQEGDVRRKTLQNFNERSGKAIDSHPGVMNCSNMDSPGSRNDVIVNG